MSPRRAIDEQLALRPAKAADTDFARSLHHVALRDVVMRQFGAWDEALQDAFFAQEWDPERFEIVLLDGVPCGYLRVVEHEPTQVEVRELVIEPAYQRLGIGTRILSDIFTTASRPVFLKVLHLNEAAQLYRRLGFEETGRTDTHILMLRAPS